MRPRLGGTWVIFLAGQATQSTIAGGVTPIGRRTARGWLIVLLGLAETPLEEKMAGFTWSQTAAMKMQ